MTGRLLRLSAIVGVVLTCLVVPASARFTPSFAKGTAQEFEVFFRGGKYRGPQMFCSAGMFAKRQLGASNHDRLVVIRGLGPSPTTPNRRSMSFTLVGPDGRAPWWNNVILKPQRGVGQSRSVGHSLALCDQDL